MCLRQASCTACCCSSNVLLVSQESEGKEEDSEDGHEEDHQGVEGSEEKEDQGTAPVDAHAKPTLEFESRDEIGHDAKDHAELELRDETMHNGHGETHTKRKSKRSDHHTKKKEHTKETDDHEKDDHKDDHHKEDHRKGDKPGVRKHIESKGAGKPQKTAKGGKKGSKAKKHADGEVPGPWNQDEHEQHGVSMAEQISNSRRLWQSAKLGSRMLAPAKDAAGMLLQAVGNVRKLLRGFAAGDPGAAESLLAVLEAQAEASEKQAADVKPAPNAPAFKLPAKELPKLGREEQGVDSVPPPSPPYAPTLTNPKFNREVQGVLIRIMVDGGILADDSEKTLYDVLLESSLISEHKSWKDATAQDYAEILRAEFIDVATVADRLVRKAVKLASQLASGNDEAAKSLLAAVQGWFSSDEEEEEEEEGEEVLLPDNTVVSSEPKPAAPPPSVRDCLGLYHFFRSFCSQSFCSIC